MSKRKKKQKVVPSANEVKITSTTEGPKTVVEIVITNPNTPTVVTVENGDSDSCSESDSCTSTSSCSDSDDYCDESECSDSSESTSDWEDDSTDFSDDEDYDDEYGDDEDYEGGEPQKMYGGNESIVNNPPPREMGTGQREVVLKDSQQISGEAVIELLKIAFGKTHAEALYLAHLCSQQGEAVVKYLNADEEEATQRAIQAAKDEIVLNYGEQREMNTIANLELEFRDRTAQETPPAPAPNEHDQVDVDAEEVTAQDEGDSDIGMEDSGDSFIDNGFSDDDDFGDDDDGGNSELGPTS